MASFIPQKAHSMSKSERLSLSYMQPSQAQKHVTHNEALQRLDILVQLAVEGIHAATPPALPADGEIWALGAAPTGTWAGHADTLATWANGSWYFITPQEGWQALDKSTSKLKIRTAAGWDDMAQPDLDDLPGVGINTIHDANNRLSIAAPATLLSHEGSGHQLKLNKATATDAASLLFQTDWSGRAEMGTVGGDDFAIKVSADGSAWTTALSIDKASGTVSGAAVQQNASDTTAGRLARADFSYSPGNLLDAVAHSGGVPSGGVIERGSNGNGEFVRFADGTQICWLSGLNMGSIVAHGSGTWASPYRTDAVSLIWPAAFVDTPAASLAFGPVGTGVPVDARVLVANVFEAPDTTGWGFIRATRIGDDAHDVDIELSVIAMGHWI